jgi:hypothetical protein
MTDIKTKAVTQELLQRVVADLNFVPETADRVARMTGLAEDTNRRIAQAAVMLPFDSSPYAFPDWLATLEPR